MDNQQSNKSSKEISEILKSIDDWLEKTNKDLKYNSMYIQNQYKSSERKSGSSEKIDKWLLECDIKELKGSLKELVEKALEKAGISEPERFDASISLYCCNDNGSLWCTYDSTIEIYENSKRISCEPNIPYLPDKLECIDHSDKSLFKLLNLSDRLSSIKDKILDIHKTAYPEVLMNLGNQSITIDVNAYIDQKKTEKANSKIIKDNNSLVFDMGDFYIRMYWHTDKHC